MSDQDRRPLVGENDPGDIDECYWHLDLHDAVVACPSQEVALRLQSWWDSAERLRARVAELEAAAASARISGINAERRRIVGCIKDLTGQRISDGGQYRADIRSSLTAWRDAAVAEATKATTKVEWRDGIPSTEDFREHEKRCGGMWCYRYHGFVSLYIVDVHSGGIGTVEAAGGDHIGFEDLPGDGEGDWRPCRNDVTPVPWPVHDTAAPEVDADATVTDGPSGDCEGVTGAS